MSVLTPKTQLAFHYLKELREIEIHFYLLKTASPPTANRNDDISVRHQTFISAQCHSLQGPHSNLVNTKMSSSFPLSFHYLQLIFTTGDLSLR